MEKNLPANAGDVGSSCREDALEESVVIHFNILTWEITRTEELGRL